MLQRRSGIYSQDAFAARYSSVAVKDDASQYIGEYLCMIVPYSALLVCKHTANTGFSGIEIVFFIIKKKELAGFESLSEG